MRQLKQPRKSFALRHFAMPPLLALLGACNPMDGFLGPSTFGGCLFICASDYPPVAFAVSPDSARMLRGDTLTAYAWNCPYGGCFGGLRVASSWTIAGSAVAPITASGGHGNLTAVSEVLLRAVAVGESQITAVAATDSAKMQTIRVTVADSSAITTVALQTCCNGRDTVVKDGDVLSALRDQAGRRYRGHPTAWIVSDPSLITFSNYPSKFGAGARMFHVKKAGVVEIRATFLNVEGRVQVVVRP